MCSALLRVFEPGAPPQLFRPVAPRPSHRETSETQPSRILSGMSRPRYAALCRAMPRGAPQRQGAAGGWGRRQRRARGVATGG
jgi:hypothetical protein